MMKLPEKKSVQGSFWCSACNGSGKKKYINWRGELGQVMCPICFGHPIYFFSKKSNDAPKNINNKPPKITKKIEVNINQLKIWDAC